MEPIRLIVIDDHRLFRDGLRALLLVEQSNAKVVGEGAGVADALKILETIECDVIAISVTPIDPGLAAIRRLRESHPELPILALANADVNHVMEVVQEGAHGYIGKVAPISDFLVALETVSQGGAYIHPRAASSILKRIRSGQPGASREGIQLTPREQAVLDRLSLGLNNGEIAAQLYLSASTVKSTIRSLFTKFSVNDRTFLVATAVSKGLVQRVMPSQAV